MHRIVCAGLVLVSCTGQHAKGPEHGGSPADLGDAANTAASTANAPGAPDTVVPPQECAGRVHFCGQVFDLAETQLSCDDPRVADASPLSCLEQLSFLWLGGTGITDVKPLRGLEHLASLDLSRTDVADLRPLSSLPSLEELNICQTNVVDLRPVASLPNLKILWIADVPASNSEIDRLAESKPSLDILDPAELQSAR